MLQNLKEILGETGFRVLENPIIVGIKDRFGIGEFHGTLVQIVEIARKNYIHSSLSENDQT